jgi:hypothetical protein
MLAAVSDIRLHRSNTCGILRSQMSGDDHTDRAGDWWKPEIGKVDHHIPTRLRGSTMCSSSLNSRSLLQFALIAPGDLNPSVLTMTDEEQEIGGQCAAWRVQSDLGKW